MTIRTLLVAACVLLAACGGRDGGDAKAAVAADSLSEAEAGIPQAAPRDSVPSGDGKAIVPPAEVPPELQPAASAEAPPVPRSTEPARGNAVSGYEECMARARQAEDAEARQVMEDGCKLLPRTRS